MNSKIQAALDTVREHVSREWFLSSRDTYPVDMSKPRAALDVLARELERLEAERNDYRFWNERVRVCEHHTQDVAAPVGDCLVCNVEAERARADRLAAELAAERIDKEYAVERAAALATGVGIARVRLPDDPVGAKDALDDACGRCPDLGAFIARYRAALAEHDPGVGNPKPDHPCVDLYSGRPMDDRGRIAQEAEHGSPEEARPLCPHCGSPSLETKYATEFHEHHCGAGHVWRVY